jgi:hypothetical protein
MKWTVRARAGVRAAQITVILASLSAACGDDDSGGGLTCIEVDPDCMTAFPANWDNVFKFVIDQRCGTGEGVACHGTDGHQGGLILSGQDQAYDHLVNGKGGHARVLPKDPACSILMERISSSDANVRMPLGSAALSDGDKCGVQKWIAQGAGK